MSYWPSYVDLDLTEACITIGKNAQIVKALTLFTPGCHPCPVAKEALRGIVALEHVAVPALKLAHHAMVQAWRNDHAILGSLWQLCTLGCKDIFIV